MSKALRCRVTGCDPDPCGVCRRCGQEDDARHDWTDAERSEPCYAVKSCSRCGATRKSPDHDWTPSGTDPMGNPELKCSRCGLAI